MARASASVRACSRSRVLRGADGGRHRRDRRRVVEVAAGRRVRQQQVVADERRPGSRCRAASNPRRGARSATTATPASVWSPGQPLPMSCSRAPTSSRSGRATRRVKAAAFAAVSTRCRSTVNRWTGLRCGRLRTRSQSGMRRVDEPGLVQGLPHRDRRGPGAEQARRARRGRSPATARASGGLSAASRSTVCGESRSAVLRGGGRGAQDQRGVVLAVGRRARARPRRPARRRRRPAARAAARVEMPQRSGDEPAAAATGEHRTLDPVPGHVEA